MNIHPALTQALLDAFRDGACPELEYLGLRMTPERIEGLLLRERIPIPEAEGGGEFVVGGGRIDVLVRENGAEQRLGRDFLFEAEVAADGSLRLLPRLELTQLD